MKLYNSIGPNPKMVRMFIAEKGLDVPMVDVDIMGMENRQGPYLNVNPAGQCPALEMDNGEIVTEITAICEYLDDANPEPPLIGTTPEERAETRMWTRRVDLNICEPMANAFRYSDGLKMFQDRIHCLPEAADGLKAVTQEKLAWLDGLMDGKPYIAGDRFTLADVLLFAFVEFGNRVGQPPPESCQNLSAWFARVSERPSANV